MQIILEGVTGSTRPSHRSDRFDVEADAEFDADAAIEQAEQMNRKALEKRWRVFGKGHSDKLNSLYCFASSIASRSDTIPRRNSTKGRAMSIKGFSLCNIAEVMFDGNSTGSDDCVLTCFLVLLESLYPARLPTSSCTSPQCPS
jgi:hypothetical protein